MKHILYCYLVHTHPEKLANVLQVGYVPRKYLFYVHSPVPQIDIYDTCRDKSQLILLRLEGYNLIFSILFLPVHILNFSCDLRSCWFNYACQFVLLWQTPRESALPRREWLFWLMVSNALVLDGLDLWLLSQWWKLGDGTQMLSSEPGCKRDMFLTSPL